MEISENNLIKRLRKYGKGDRKVLRGIGDDGAVVSMADSQYVFVQDVMTEHVHFEFSFLDPHHLGKKALLVNISDILAMGAKPLYYLVTIGVPAGLTSHHIEALYKGMNQAAREFGVILLGGDTSASDTFFVDVSVVGRLVTAEYLGRDKARQGDLIGVTGYLGEAAYGLRLLLEGERPKGCGRFLKRFMDPRLPRESWQELVNNDITKAMMDISDGLIIDLERMMAESKKGAEIHLEEIPIPSLLKRKGLTELALTGGEDYQLLFTFPRKKLAAVEGLKADGHAISVIGEVVKGRGVRLLRDGKKVEFSGKGYQHFGEGHA